MFKKLWRPALSLALAAAMGVSTTTTPAAAANITGTVELIQYSQASGLLVQVGGQLHWAQTATQAGCTANNKTMDTIKAWQAMGTSAMLSGKTVLVDYTTCGGARYINIINFNAT